jgi:two-component system, LytTR family, response regulator
MPFTALLVDDEPNNLENLRFMLENDCTGVEIAGVAGSGPEAREWLNDNTVDVVFLDINMPGENGFEMLEKLHHYQFLLVIVTAYNEYALRAIKASAVDYLLKPININELQQTVEKIKQGLQVRTQNGSEQALVRELLKNIQGRQQGLKIALPQLGGATFLEVDTIVSLQADGNYTIIHCKDLQKKVITKTLKDFEEILDDSRFVRIHKSHIVNLAYVKEFSTADGGIVKMCDGNIWGISRRQIELFTRKMRSFNIVFFK